MVVGFGVLSKRRLGIIVMIPLRLNSSPRIVTVSVDTTSRTAFKYRTCLQKLWLLHLPVLVLSVP